MPDYDDANYWDDRYTTQKDTTFDWLEGWDELKEIIEKHCIDGLYQEQELQEGQSSNPKGPSSNFMLMESGGNQPSNKNLVPIAEDEQTAIKNKLQIMNLGCGNSVICEEMYDEGYHHISNMDISKICIDQMKERNQKLRYHMKWEVMDVLELKYPDGCFDLIVDKSTIDAMLCGDQAYLNVAVMLRECQRVLKEGGYYVAISYGQPENRIFHFKRAFLHVNLTTYQIQKGAYEGGPKSYHYIYILKKLANADQVCQKNWDRTYNQIKKEIDDEQSESELNSNRVTSQTPPSDSSAIKNEASGTNNEEHSEQSTYKLNANNETDEKTYEAQFKQDYSKDAQFGGSNFSGEAKSKQIV